jgi:spore coat protein CotF
MAQTITARIEIKESDSVSLSEVVMQLCVLEERLRTKGFESAANLIHNSISAVTAQNLNVQARQRMEGKRAKVA